MATGVWLGRFQPVHKGHLDFLRAAGEHCERIFVFAVGSSLPKDEGINADVMDRSHDITRNPYGLAERFRWLTMAVEELGSLRCRIFCSMGPRIDYDPDFYRMALPQDRVFLVSDRDAEEDRKRVLLEMAGETCLTVKGKQWSRISSTLVRQALANSDRRALRDMLPKSICNEFIDKKAGINFR